MFHLIIQTVIGILGGSSGRCCRSLVVVAVRGVDVGVISVPRRPVKDIVVEAKIEVDVVWWLSIV